MHRTLRSLEQSLSSLRSRHVVISANLYLITNGFSRKQNEPLGLKEWQMRGLRRQFSTSFPCLSEQCITPRLIVEIPPGDAIKTLH